MVYQTLNFEQVDMVHKLNIEDFGGLKGSFPDTKDRVKSVLAQIEEFFGYERYKTIEEKASALLYFFTKSHCYIDGNKRLAFSCCDIFLTINGKELTLSEEEAIILVLEIAQSNKRGEEIEEYIRQISNRLKENCIEI